MALILLIAIASLLVSATAIVAPDSSFPTSDIALLRNYPAPPSYPATVYRINHTNRTVDAQLTLFTLQGALARLARNTTTASFPLLYKTTATANTSTDGTWTYWAYYQGKYGGRVQFVDKYADSSVEEIVAQFSRYVSGYYLSHYTEHSEADNVNMAISQASITDGAIVTTAAYATLMKQLNITLIQDMRSYTESTFLNQFQPLNQSTDAPQWPFSHQFISSQTPTKAATFLTDWSMLASAVTLHHIPTAQAVLDLVPQGPFAWLGWTADTWGENDMTSKVSAAGGYVWAADTQNNLGTHAFFRDPLAALPGIAVDVDVNKGKHTVAFLFTDGDSLVADTGAVVDSRHWLDARRGSFPLSFGIDPSLALLAPSTLALMYDTAGINDSIVAFAPGYAYPSFMNDYEVQVWAAEASGTMAAAGLRINYYIDFNYSARYFAPLLHQSNIDGVVYFDYPNYYVLDNGRNGTVTWVDSKPAIAVRDSLWAGHSTPESIAAMLNQQVRDNTQTSGYSVIAAHLWSQDVGTISEVVQRLDGEGVMVVRVDELIALMSAHVKEADRMNAEVPTPPNKRKAQPRAQLATE